MPVAWQAQYTGRPGRAAARVAASGAAAAFCVAGAVHRAAWTSCCCGLPPLGPRLPFAWQAQCTEPPGGAASRVSAAAFARQLPLIIHPSSRTTKHISFITCIHHVSRTILTAQSPLLTSHSSFTTHHYITSHSHLSLSHDTLSHPNSSSLITAPLISTTHHSFTASLLTPH